MVRLFYFIAYYPQTNRQSERINQIMEIVFPFLISSFKDPKNWPKLADPIQKTNNDFKKVVTERFANKDVYDFILVQSIDFTRNLPEVLLSFKNVRLKITNVIARAQINAKIDYDE